MRFWLMLACRAAILLPLPPHGGGKLAITGRLEVEGDFALQFAPVALDVGTGHVAVAEAEGVAEDHSMLSVEVGNVDEGRIAGEHREDGQLQQAF